MLVLQGRRGKLSAGPEDAAWPAHAGHDPAALRRALGELRRRRYIVVDMGELARRARTPASPGPSPSRLTTSVCSNASPESSGRKRCYVGGRSERPEVDAGRSGLHQVARCVSSSGAAMGQTSGEGHAHRERCVVAGFHVH